MAGSLTISLTNLSANLIGSSKRAEATEIMWMIDTALQKIVSNYNIAQPVTILDRAGNSAGTLGWTPVNTT